MLGMPAQNLLVNLSRIYTWLTWFIFGGYYLVSLVGMYIRNNCHNSSSKVDENLYAIYLFAMRSHHPVTRPTNFRPPIESLQFSNHTLTRSKKILPRQNSIGNNEIRLKLFFHHDNECNNNNVEIWCEIFGECSGVSRSQQQQRQHWRTAYVDPRKRRCFSQSKRLGRRRRIGRVSGYFWKLWRTIRERGSCDPKYKTVQCLAPNNINSNRLIYRDKNQHYMEKEKKEALHPNLYV